MQGNSFNTRTRRVTARSCPPCSGSCNQGRNCHASQDREPIQADFDIEGPYELPDRIWAWARRALNFAVIVAQITAMSFTVGALLRHFNVI